MNKQNNLIIIFIILLSRTIFAIFTQGIFALATQFTNEPLTFLEAGRWWTVYGSLIDIGCFSLLVLFLKKEGVGLGSLIGFSRKEIKRDLKLAAFIFILVLPLTIAWGAVISMLIYGIVSAPIIAGPLPSWAALYSVLIWPIGWAIMEQVVYMGYCLPRLESILKNKAAAVVIVMIFWALQHVALPITFDQQYSLYRFLTVIPMVVIPIAYLKTRRLFPLILVHALFDIMSALSFYFFPVN